MEFPYAGAGKCIETREKYFERGIGKVVRDSGERHFNDQKAVPRVWVH